MTTSGTRGLLGTHWRNYLPWFTVGSLALASLVLGTIGFAQRATELGSSRPPLDLFYLALQLFVLESGALTPPIPWQLEVARLLAPAVAAYAFVRALAVVFREQVEALRIRRLRDHVVICGLGRLGLLLARSLLARGEAVVAIERNLASERVPIFRAEGGLAQLGDARSERALRAAGVLRARRLVAISESDGMNAEIVTRASEIVRDRREGRELSCVAQIIDPGLCTLLRLQEMERHPDDPFRLELFNTFESAARQLLDEHPVDRPLENDASLTVHALVVGLGSFGQQLVRELARRWSVDHENDASNLQITVIDPQAETRLGALGLRSSAGSHCELVPHDFGLDAPSGLTRELLHEVDHPPITTVYVCVEEEPFALSAGLTLHRHLGGRGAPVVVRVDEGAGIASLLRATGRGGEEFQTLHVFGLADRVADPEIIFGGVREVIARAIHQDYLRSQRAEGSSLATNPSLVPWKGLPESLRESNRAQADHLFVKLRAVGCDLAPSNDAETPTLRWASEEVERLAEMEHERWMQERLRSGWELGPKDVERKRSPHLVPWEELSESVKKIDREAVLGLPRFLARVGFRIERLGSV